MAGKIKTASAAAFAAVLFLLPGSAPAQVSDVQQKARKEVYKALADKKISASEIGAKK